MTTQLRSPATLPRIPGPRLTVGLPVHNGERFLRQSLDALLSQTFNDFELIISDNASTDSTPEICASYARRDPRIRYVRQPVNIGSAPNHNAVVALARGEYFKWASDDDLYGADLLGACVAELDAHSEIVLCHAFEAFIDESGKTIQPVTYRLQTADPRAWVRLRSLLYVSGGDDIYGVIRTSALRRNGEHGSYHNADRTFVAALAMSGPFHQVPRVLYFRRDHPQRTERRSDRRRSRAAILDPRRANRLRHPMLRLYVEYVWGYVAAIRGAPISLTEKARCLGLVLWWALGHLRPGSAKRLLTSPDPAVVARAQRALKPANGHSSRLVRPRKRAHARDSQDTGSEA
jgi:glycosyltransferase involved in cell wall biosynthesis